jgi:hypothetical protein
LLPSPASGDQTFPYKTIVSSDDVYVRSGPGQNYYPTEKLRRGQEVEVYRLDPGGWCAIRPVDGSFSWVSGRFLKPTEAPLAVVTEDGVSARVGSRFSDIRDVIQVRLQKGEEVEILESPPQGSRGREGWYKIAPPSGEFRWVSAKHLDADYPIDGVRKTSEGSKHAHRHNPSADDDSMAVRSSRPRSLPAEGYEAELTRIELELSAMVTENPTTWSFDEIRERTNRLLDEAQTAVERGRARLLANKIARFDDIKQRQDAVLAMRDSVDRESRLLAHLKPRDVDGEVQHNADADIDGRFDGVGQLTQVVSPKLGAPRYALTDKTGDVRCYVTPAPGVNMQNYIGQRVGVTGTRGYVPDEHASHIMARHITPLDGRMLR